MPALQNDFQKETKNEVIDGMNWQTDYVAAWEQIFIFYQFYLRLEK